MGHRNNAYFSRNRLSDRGKQHSSFSCRYSEVALLAQRLLETSKVRLCGKPLAKRKPEGQVRIFPKNQHSLVSAFCEQAKDMLKQISFLKQQNRKLRDGRDLLLPRLMSGEIAV